MGLFGKLFGFFTNSSKEEEPTESFFELYERTMERYQKRMEEEKKEMEKKKKMLEFYKCIDDALFKKIHL